MAGKPALHVYLEGDAHTNLHEWCAENGVSVSGLLQVVASDPEKVLGPKAATILKEARGVDATRRRRGRGPASKAATKPAVKKVPEKASGKRSVVKKAPAASK